MDRTKFRPELLAILGLCAARLLTSNLSSAEAQEPKTTGAVVRECKPGYDNPVGSMKASGLKRKNRAKDLSLAAACVEVKQQSLLIQEYLQKVIRDLRWNIADEQVSEDFWSFSVYLKAEDLAAYTKPPAEPKVMWRGGKALVTIRTYELADGFARVVVTARFNGYGDPEDQFAPKRESWPLASSGALEAKLTSVAKEHFRAVP